DVACEDVGYGGVDDEPDPCGVDVCGVDYSGTWNSQGGTSLRDASTTLPRDGRGQHCLCGDAGGGCSLFCKILNALPSWLVACNLSICSALFARPYGCDGAT